jgi:hypothetical protein
MLLDSLRTLFPERIDVLFQHGFALCRWWGSCPTIGAPPKCPSNTSVLAWCLRINCLQAPGNTHSQSIPGDRIGAGAAVDDLFGVVVYKRHSEVSTAGCGLLSRRIGSDKDAAGSLDIDTAIPSFSICRPINLSSDSWKLLFHTMRCVEQSIGLSRLA